MIFACEYECCGKCVYTRPEVQVGIYESCIFAKLVEPYKSEHMSTCPQLHVIHALDKLADACEETTIK